MDRYPELTAEKLHSLFVALPIEVQRHFLELCLKGPANAVGDRVQELRGTLRTVTTRWGEDMVALSKLNMDYIDLLHARLGN